MADVHYVPPSRTTLASCSRFVLAGTREVTSDVGEVTCYGCRRSIPGTQEWLAVMRNEVRMGLRASIPDASTEGEG